MRLPPVLIASSLMLTIAACATAPATPSQTANNPAADADTSGPAPLADHDWVFNQSEGPAALLYGPKDSDDIWVVLTCDPGSAALKILQPAVTAHPIQLESGGDTETYAADPIPGALHDLMLSAPASPRDPVFQRFRRVGWLATWGEGGRVMMAAQPGSLKNITDFFDVCG